MLTKQFRTTGNSESFLFALFWEEPADANSDGYLTASEIGMYLGDRVTNLTESAQTPRYGKLRI